MDGTKIHLITEEKTDDLKLEAIRLVGSVGCTDPQTAIKTIT